jgi:hypothetical protein
MPILRISKSLGTCIVRSSTTLRGTCHFIFISLLSYLETQQWLLFCLDCCQLYICLLRPVLLRVLGSRVLRRIQGVSGLFGMVAPCDKVCLLHPIVGLFHTGDTIRVVLPAEVIGISPWILEDNKSCGLKLTYDLPRAKSLGTLTVRVCWCSTIYRDELHFVTSHFKY